MGGLFGENSLFSKAKDSLTGAVPKNEKELAETAAEKAEAILPRKDAAKEALAVAKEMEAVNNVIEQKPGAKTNDPAVYRYVQRQLGLKPTGRMSNQLKTRIEKFQADNNLKDVDGIPGKDTLLALREKPVCGPDYAALKLPGGTQCVHKNTISAVAALSGGPLAGLAAQSPELRDLATGIYNGAIDKTTSPESKELLKDVRDAGGKAWTEIRKGLGTIGDTASQAGKKLVSGSKQLWQDSGAAGATEKAGAAVGRFFKKLGEKNAAASSQGDEPNPAEGK